MKVLFVLFLIIALIALGWSVTIYFQHWDEVLTPKQQMILGWKPAIMWVIGVMGMYFTFDNR